jgi:hypothetical protein
MNVLCRRVILCRDIFQKGRQVIAMSGNLDPRRGGHLLLVSLLVVALLIIPACGHDNNTGTTVVVQAPVITVLPVGSLVADSVAYRSFNYYAAAVVPESFYKISITGMSDDADLLVFSDDGTFTVLAQCSIDNTAYIGTTAEDCVIRAPGSTLYFGVDGYYLAGSVGFFTIDVEPVATTSLTLSVPLLDTLARWEARIYAVPAPVTDNYTISITGMSNDADLHVFGTFLNAPATCPNTQKVGTTFEDCTIPSAGGVLYFVVDGLFSSTATVRYTALAAPAIP